MDEKLKSAIEGGSRMKRVSLTIHTLPIGDQYCAVSERYGRLRAPVMSEKSRAEAIGLLCGKGMFHRLWSELVIRGINHHHSMPRLRMWDIWAERHHFDKAEIDAKRALHDQAFMDKWDHRPADLWSGLAL